MKKRFLSAMALLLGAGVTWADPGTVTSPASPAVPGKPPAAKGATSTAAAPRSIKLPEATPLQAPMPAAPTQITTPPAPVTTTPAAPGAKAAAASAAKAAPAAQSCQPPAPPKVDLRDCHSGPELCYWAGAEYLLWWLKQGPLPVTLVTTAPGTAGGAIGGPGTAVAIGNTSFDYGTLSGGRFEGGAWLNQRHTVGIDAAFFFLGQGSDSLAVASSPAGAPLLARPFFNVVTSAPSAFLVSAPGALAGGVTVNSQSQLWGLETNFIRNLYYNCNFRADLTFGFRNINLEENLSVAQATTVLPGGPTTLFLGGVPAGGAGSQLLITDRFGTVNHFYGGQIGGLFRYYRGNWVVDAMAKVALGVNHEAVNILGQTDVRTGGGVSTATGGLLAVNNSNFGPRINDTTDYFAVAPEVKLGIGYQFNRYLRATVAWDFLYLSGVARPGDHVDTAVNPTLVPSSATFAGSSPLSPVTGPFAPNLNIRQTDFWAQGVNFGLLFTY